MSISPFNPSESNHEAVLPEPVKQFLLEHSATYIIEVEEDVSLQLLLSRKWLSVRAVNICQIFWLDSLSEIYDFLEENGTFKKLKNCGKRSELELIALCAVYKNRDEPVEKKYIPKQKVNELSGLSPLKQSGIHQQVDFLITKLSNRARNALLTIFPNNDIDTLLTTIYDKEFNFKSIKNIGSKSIVELTKFKNQISEIIIQTKQLPEDEVNNAKALLTIILTYEYPSLLPFVDNFFTPNGKIKLFLLFHTIFYSCQFFNEAEMKVFLSVYNTATITRQTTQTSIAADMGVSIDNFRRLMLHIRENVKTHLYWLPNFNQKDLACLELNTNANFEVIDNQFVERIIKEESVNFNMRFCALFLAAVLKKTHAILGDDKLYSGKNSPHVFKQLRYCYAINIQLFEAFDFLLFLNTFIGQLYQIISNPLKIRFNTFIKEFLKADSQHLLPEILPICQTIVQLEFDCEVKNGLIVFKPNMTQQ